MVNYRKILVLALGLAVAYPSTGVWAQENRADGTTSNENNPQVVAAPVNAPVVVAAPAVPAAEPESKPAILLKINNIKTVKNDDDLPIGCDFDTVIYNRTHDIISGATVNMSWVDETIQGVIEDEQKQKAKADAAAASTKADVTAAAAPNQRAVSRRAKIQQTADTEAAAALTFVLEVPEVKPFSQVVISSHLKSDKCFLLIGDANLSVQTCNATASETSSNNPVAKRVGGVGNGGCTGVFQFISSKDSQYYRDFKKVDPEAERLANLSKQDRVRENVEADFQKAMQEMDAITKELSTIQ